MSTPQRFGDYLLFRKLTTDALGETYRAGKVGEKGIERVVLLRLFNGPGVDGRAIAAVLAERQEIGRALQNPHIGEGAETGRVGEVPFAAYEYISGKTLAELLDETRSRVYPIPIEHALFVVERVTFGMSAAYSTRHREQRILHGFLVPDLIELSNEGEVRILGFESAPALRQSLGAPALREAYGRYLAPEVAPGSPTSSPEDVFSLGAVLFELLTGQVLERVEDADYEAMIDDAVVAAEDAPLPPSIRALLKSSLAPKDERISDVQQWQQALSRFIAEGGHNPTTFNLAFFMHSLFRGEIERETAEIAQEQTQQIDLATVIVPTPEVEPDLGETVMVPPPVADRPAPAAAAQPKAPPAAVDRPTPSARYGRKGPSKGMLAAAAVAIAVGGGLTAYFMTRDEPAAEIPLEAASELPEAAAEEPPVESPTPDLADVVPVAGGEGASASSTGTGSAEPTPPAATAESTTDAAQPARAAGAQPKAAEDLVAEAIADLELTASPPGNLQRRENARRQAADAGAVDQMQEQIRALVDQRAEELEGSLAEKYEDELEALRQQLDEAKQAQEEVERLAAEQAAAEQAAAEQAAAEQAAAEKAAAEAAAEAAAQPTSPAQQGSPGQVTQTVTPIPVPEAVQPGELVEPGPGVTAPRIIDRPRPRYPPSARRLGKVATVVLRLLVDENGRVSQVERAGPNVGFGFDQEAISAARATTWSPATKSGVPVKMWVDLRIEFRP